MADVQDNDGNIETARSLPRTNTDPSWPEEHLSTQPSNVTANDGSHAPPLLRKRHSTLSISPHDPPRRPARNPARSDPLHPKPKPIVVTRPSDETIANSTPTGTKEDVTPWELFSAPESGATEASSSSLHIETNNFPSAISSSTTTPASASPLSSRLKAFQSSQPSTGPVTDVTPWELYPVPPSSPTTDSTATSIQNSKKAGSSVNTGRVEDVTPWELYEVPDIIPQRTNLSTLATGPIEDVTPWDLIPSPTQATQSPMSAPPTGTTDKSRSTLRVSTSSSSTGSGSNNKTLADIAHVVHLRRRKSTGAKAYSSHQASKGRSNTGSANQSPVLEQSSLLSMSSGMGFGSRHRSATSSATSVSVPRRGLRTSTSTKSLPTTPKLGKAQLGPNSQALPPPPYTEHSLSDAHSAFSSDLQLHTSSEVVAERFSTADRTILEELKKSLQIREAQFVFKGAATDIACPLAKPKGKKHHPFNEKEAPYPRNYEREVLDLDVWEIYCNRDSCDSWTWHVFDTPPVKVLDLGCGTGTWILNCANQWKETEFVGLDLVPIQPDLNRVGSSELPSRITWIHHNFLEGLPFANEEFDYIHVKRISLGVPENKWDFLFEEIARVLRPNGAFEMFEEDLAMPGQLLNDLDGSGEDDASSIGGASLNRHNTKTIQDSIVQNSQPESIDHTGLHPRDSINGSSTLVTDSSSYRDSIDTLASTVVYGFDESTHSQSPAWHLRTSESEERAEAVELLKHVMVDYEQKQLEKQASFPPTSNNVETDESIMNNPTDNITTPTQPTFSDTSSMPHSAQGSPPISNANPKFVDSAVSLSMSSVVEGVSPIELPVSAPALRGTRQRGYSAGSSERPTEPTRVKNGPHPPIFHTNPEIPPVPKMAPPMVKTGQPATDPRDHSLLSLIWEEMLLSRFINGSPLALLHNSLILYFKDVQSHPPLQIAFPPSSKQRVRLGAHEKERKILEGHRNSRGSVFDSLNEHESGNESDDARDAIVPSPLTRTSSYSNLSDHQSAKQMSQMNIEPIAEADFGGDEQIPEERRYVDVAGLLKRESKWMALDNSRYSAYGPNKTRSLSTLAPLDTNIPAEPAHTSPGVQRKISRGSGLPNPTMHLDQRQVSLHLALRTAEILACSEAMWEWVTEHQAKMRREEAQRQEIQRSISVDSYGLPPRKSISSSISTISAGSSKQRDQLRDLLVGLNRKEFDILVNNFEMDMRDNYSLGGVLEDRFAWSSMATPPCEAQKAFRAACERWESEVYKVEVTSQSTGMSFSSQPSASGRLSHASSVSDGPPIKRRERTLTTSSTGWALVPPSKRLSRSVRVFTAFKSQGPLFRDLAGHKKGTQPEDLKGQGSSDES